MFHKERTKVSSSFDRFYNGIIGRDRDVQIFLWLKWRTNKITKCRGVNWTSTEYTIDRVYRAGNITGRSLVGAVSPERSSMVPAARVVASLQRRRADGSDPLASFASALGDASANHHGKAEPGGGGCQALARHPTEIQGDHGRPRGIRLYEGHRPLPPR